MLRFLPRKLRLMFGNHTDHVLPFEFVEPLIAKLDASTPEAKEVKARLKGMDQYEIFEAMAAWISKETGVWCRYTSHHGFLIITETEAEFIQWKLTWL